MKIALFTEVFLPKIDGVVTRLRHTLVELEKRGDEVLMFAPGESDGKYHAARIVGMRGSRFPLYPEINLAFPRASIRQQLLTFAPDVIHAVDATCLGAAAVYYADVLDLPLVVSYHTRLPKYLRYYGMGALEPLAYALLRFRHNRAQVNVCTSSVMVDELRAHGISQVHLWPKAVDTEAFHPRFASLAMREWLSQGQPERPLLLYVGRLSIEKNIKRLRRVLEAFPEVRLALVGGGPHEKQMREYFEGKNAFFAGYLTGRSLAEAMASADMMVLPSETETLGLVLLEGMACGAAVIGAKAGGIPDLISDGQSGFLFDPADDGSLTRLVGQLLADPGKVSGVRRRGRLEAERCNWHAATRELRTFYEKAIEMPREPKRVAKPFFEKVIKKTTIGGLKLFLS